MREEIHHLHFIKRLLREIFKYLEKGEKIKMIWPGSVKLPK